MKKTTSKISWIILLAVAVILSMPMTNYAQDHGHEKDNPHDRKVQRNADHHDRHAIDHGRKGKVVVRHDDYREVIVNNRHVFYHGGAFYEKGPRGYVSVAAPIGARIAVLPGGYKVIRRHSARFYLFGGIYYKFIPNEHVYVVVSAPF